MKIPFHGTDQPLELLRVFQTECSTVITFVSELKRQDSFSQNDQQRCAHLLHRLKGSSGFLGLSDLADAFTKAEVAMREACTRETLDQLMDSLLPIQKELTDIITSADLKSDSTTEDFGTTEEN